jgi:hypothetical protein
MMNSNGRWMFGRKVRISLTNPSDMMTECPTSSQDGVGIEKGSGKTDPSASEKHQSSNRTFQLRHASHGILGRLTPPRPYIGRQPISTVPR